MGPHSVTCHPAEVTFLPLPQPKLVLDWVTPEGCKAELTWLACYIPRWYTRPKTVTHPGTNRARHALTSFHAKNAANHYAMPPTNVCVCVHRQQLCPSLIHIVADPVVDKTLSARCTVSDDVGRGSGCSSAPPTIPGCSARAIYGLGVSALCEYAIAA